ncbi:hypothetical protein [Actinomyces oris]|uniref:hypothetical protein n=1 Tax=Actinomyces oris TaxID=544580 RepID=UPI00094C0BCD|nr:hypothetical protein [Actinomyces oris]OLO68025.1 hypothetical protein BKH19_12315 [Actinomyces oris]
MSEIQAFLRDAAALAGVSKDEILAEVLHAGDGRLAALLGHMDDETRSLVLRLDREIRLRNPGLHYVQRKQFVGYRREGAGTPSPTGERSQIFLSIIRNSSRLDVVLPVDPDSIVKISNAQDLRGKGHHGVGEVRVALRDDSDIDRLLKDLDAWLRPNRTSS